MKPKTSPIWNYFVEINRSSAQCKICNKVYSRKGATTTALKSHLKSLHLEQFTEFERIDETVKLSLEAKKQEDAIDNAGNTSVDGDNLHSVEKAETDLFYRSKKIKNKKTRQDDKHKKQTDEAYNLFKELNQTYNPDECSLYCDLLCKKLRRLKENTRDIAMIEIDRLVYNLKQQDNQIPSNTTNSNGQQPYIQIPSLQSQSLLNNSQLPTENHQQVFH